MIRNDITKVAADAIVNPANRNLLQGSGKMCIRDRSMGGYVGQAYAQLYPDKMTGFVSIDSAPLQRSYVTAVELWLLKRMEPVYVHYPWKWLLKSGSEGVATSDYGRNLIDVYKRQRLRWRAY